MRYFSSILITLLLVSGVRGEPVVKQFTETDDNFVNPGQGWMVMQRLPGKPGRLPYSVAYFRLDWEQIEPTEGKFDWHLIDESIKAWSPKGVRISFRIMTTNAHSKGYYCSPKWLFDAGCKSFDYTPDGKDPMNGGGGVKRIEPNYSDPLYLTKHAKTIEALAKQFDGNPAIEFLDIGSYGIWGEWHTPHQQALEVRKQIMDMYLNTFKKTQLISMSDDPLPLAYALAHGTGFRRDGVGSPWHEENWIGSKKYAAVPGFADQWKHAPVIFEWYGPYDYMLQKGWSFDKAIDFLKANHVTLINDNIGNVPPEQFGKLQKLANVAGYRFVLREIAHPDHVARGTTLEVNMKWSNVGVGKLYRRHPLMIYLLDSKGVIVCQETQSKIDTTEWLPGDVAATATLKLPTTLTVGKYTLGMALLDPATEKPAIRIGNDIPQTDRLYQLSDITVD